MKTLIRPLAGVFIALVVLEFGLRPIASADLPPFARPSADSLGSPVVTSRQLEEGIAESHFSSAGARLTGNSTVAGAPVIVILGDSHEYDGEIEPFDKVEIDDLIMRELRKIIHLPNWMIAKRWHGQYVKHAGGAPVFEAEPLPRVHVCTGMGGAGMTLAFGLAEQAWRRWS